MVVALCGDTVEAVDLQCMPEAARALPDAREVVGRCLFVQGSFSVEVFAGSCAFTLGLLF